MLKKLLQTEELRQLAHFIMIVPSDSALTIEMEANCLAKNFQNHQDAGVLFMSHQTTSAHAVETTRQFFPEMILAQKFKDAETVRLALDERYREVLYSLTPTEGEQVGILSSTFINANYDFQLFAEYVFSHYQRRRGFPHDIYFYYFENTPALIRKAFCLLQNEIADLPEIPVVATLPLLFQCRPKQGTNGHFILARFQKQLLQLRAQLYLSGSGMRKFLGLYVQMFPHHFSQICPALKVFCQGGQRNQIHLRLMRDKNDILLESERWTVQADLYPGGYFLSIKIAPAAVAELGEFFSELQRQNLFLQMPAGRLLSHSHELLWQNRQSPDPGEEIVATSAATGETRQFKLFHRENNRLLLEETNEQQYYRHLAGDIPCCARVHPLIAEILSDFFADKIDGQSRQNWLVACLKAFEHLVGISTPEEVLNFDFSVRGDQCKVIWVCEAARQETRMPDSTIQSMMETGTDRLDILGGGNAFVLVKNPLIADKSWQQKVRHSSANRPAAQKFSPDRN